MPRRLDGNSENTSTVLREMGMNHPSPNFLGRTVLFMDDKRELPLDPMANTGGVRYLRLSNECPPTGVILQLTRPPEVIVNTKFGDRQEYHWTAIQFTPEGFDRILVESSRGFCTALGSATGGSPYGKLLQIRWKKERYNGRDIRAWSIREIKQEDLSAIFPIV